MESFLPTKAARARRMKVLYLQKPLEIEEWN